MPLKLIKEGYCVYFAVICYRSVFVRSFIVLLSLLRCWGPLPIQFVFMSPSTSIYFLKAWSLFIPSLLTPSTSLSSFCSTFRSHSHFANPCVSKSFSFLNTFPTSHFFRVPFITGPNCSRPLTMLSLFAYVISVCKHFSSCYKTIHIYLFLWKSNLSQVSLIPESIYVFFIDILF